MDDRSAQDNPLRTYPSTPHLVVKVCGGEFPTYGQSAERIQCMPLEHDACFARAHKTELELLQYLGTGTGTGISGNVLDQATVEASTALRFRFSAL